MQNDSRKEMQEVLNFLIWYFFIILVRFVSKATQDVQMKAEIQYLVFFFCKLNCYQWSHLSQWLYRRYRDRHTDRQVNEWMDGWMDRWIGGWLTILLFVAMVDQNIGGFHHSQTEELHRLFAVLVNFEDFVFEAGSIDVVFENIDSIRLGNSWKIQQTLK